MLVSAFRYFIPYTTIVSHVAYTKVTSFMGALSESYGNLERGVGTSCI